MNIFKGRLLALALVGCQGLVERSPFPTRRWWASPAAHLLLLTPVALAGYAEAGLAVLAIYAFATLAAAMPLEQSIARSTPLPPPPEALLRRKPRRLSPAPPLRHRPPGMRRLLQGMRHRRRDTSSCHLGRRSRCAGLPVGLARGGGRVRGGPARGDHVQEHHAGPARCRTDRRAARSRRRLAR